MGNPVYSNCTIQTPNGTAITALELVSEDLTSSEKKNSKDYWLDYYDNRISFAGEATYAYNCHGYAWHSSEGRNYIWINTPGDDAYWNDNSFVLTNIPSEAEKVSFASDDHSAITTSQNGYLKSKWGQAPLFTHSINDCPYNSTTLRYYRYPDPDYNNVPDKPLPVTFKMISSGSFSASVSNDSRYNVDLYEWKADYADDWYVYTQNTKKSSVSVSGSSTPRSCNLSARAHNSYGWGDWQVIGWLYASQSYSLSVAQNPVNTTLCVQIDLASEVQAIQKGSTIDVAEKSDADISTINQSYSISLHSSTGTKSYQSTANSNGNNMINLNIDVSALPNGVYFLHVKNIGTNEKPQTLNIVVKH